MEQVHVPLTTTTADCLNSNNIDDVLIAQIHVAACLSACHCINKDNCSTGDHPSLELLHFSKVKGLR